MKSLRAWVCRFAALFKRQCDESDVTQELHAHLEMQVDANIRAGMSPGEARRQATLKLGTLDCAKDAYRDRQTLPAIENLSRDLRYAARQLTRNPGFSLTATAILSLGFAAALAIFAFVHAVLLKPLPYPDPSRLMGVYESVKLFPQSNLSYADYLDWKHLNRSFHSVDVYTGAGYTLGRPTGAQVIQGARVSDGFFRTLGISPILGRDFYAGEDLPGKPNTVILSYSIWQSQFGGDKRVIGTTILLNSISHTVIGVLPPGFQFAPRGAARLWTLVRSSGSCESRRSCHNLDGIGRLNDGVSPAAALAEMKAIAAQLEKQYPDLNRGQSASVIPLAEAISGPFRPLLLMLMTGALLLLVIAVVNVANLFLVRGENRRREMAVRAALGGSRSRLLQQFATEAFPLVVVSALVALTLAHWCIIALVRLIPEDALARMPFLQNLGMNWQLALTTVLLVLVVTPLLSIVDAIRLPISNMRDRLAEGGRTSAGLTWRRLGANLVVTELAMAVVLLVGAGLLGKSFLQLMKVNLGFQPDHLALVRMGAPDVRYATNPKRVALMDEVLARISRLSGVQSVAATSVPPVSFNGNTDWIRIVGKPYNGVHNEVNERDVTEQYFSTIRAKLLSGRYFTEFDNTSKPLVVIINHALVAKYFRGEDPVGKKIGDIILSPKSIKTIVGVVDDIREGSLDSTIWPAVYYPLAQAPDTDLAIIIRTSQDEASILPAAQSALHALDPEIGVYDISTMRNHINDSETAYLHRSAAWLVAGFATLALLLSIIGLYGVIAYSVSQRTREIGVRMALGAAQTTVYKLILKEATLLITSGIAIGLALSIAAATAARGLLFGVEAWDAPTLSAVGCVLAVAALIASFIPARRAASVNPVEALRAE